MQPLAPEDLEVIGTDQTTSIYWHPAEIYNNLLGQIGSLSFDGAQGSLATAHQFDRAEYTAGSVFETLEPGLVIRLQEGYFVLEDTDFPLNP